MSSANQYDIVQSSDSPDVERLRSLFAESEQDLNAVYSYSQKCHKDRFCHWDNQSDDGRKHGTKDSPAWPWEGASDLRTWNIDDVSNKLAAKAMNALRRANVAASLSDSADPVSAGKAEQFMQWYFKRAIPSCRRSMALCAQWGISLGVAAAGVYWEQKIVKAAAKVSAEEMAERSGHIALWLADESAETPAEEAIADAKLLAGLISKKQAVDFLRNLRVAGVADMFVDKVAYSRAKIKALRVGRDIFFPAEIEDIQDSPFVFTVEYLAPNQLRAASASENWNSGFAEKLLEDYTSAAQQSRLSASDALGRSKSFRNRVRIVRAYYWAADKSGAQTLRFCVFAPDYSGDEFAVAGIMDVQRYPFALYAFEHCESEIVDSRGVAEIGEGWQREIKTQKDLRIDNASISINPPKLFRVGNRPTSEYGPGAWIPVKGQDFKIIENLNSAADPSFSVEVERSVKNDMFAYFGNVNSDNPDPAADAQTQDLVENFLSFVSEVLGIVFDYCRQYRSDAFRFMPEGAADGEIETFDPAQSPAFEFSLVFDAADLDRENFFRKFDLAAKYINVYDSNGDVNKPEILRMVMERLFPDKSRTIISAQKQSYERELLETQRDLAAIFSLQPVNAPEHCNAQLRLQVIEQYAAQPAIQGRMGVDPAFAEALQTYQKQLRFQLQQAQNAVIGRLGTAPASGVPDDSGEGVL